MTDLVTSPEEIRKKYAALAAVYRQKSWVNESLLGVKRLRQAVLPRAKGRTLEVACGTGENFGYLHQATDLTAIDLSPAMLELAQQEAERRKLSIQFHTMAAEQLQFDDARFDTVISTLSTCTFADPMVALREMQRVCRPEGRILLIEHGRSRWDWLAHYQDRHAHDHFQEAGCRWNQNPPALIEEAGLKIIWSRQQFLGIFHAIEALPNK